MRPAAAIALLGLLLTATAATFDAEPLYVPGVAFIALVVGAGLWVLAGSRGVRIERTVAVRRAVEDRPVEIDILVRSGRFALPGGRIEDPLLPAPAPVAITGRTTHVRISVRFAHRGPRRLAPPRVVVRDPFGLVSRTVSGGEEAELLVLPRVEPVVSQPANAPGAGAAAKRARPRMAAEIDLDGLRPHRPGAPASRIFWPALARTGELMERRLRADSDTRPLVVLDPRLPESDDDLDAAVRACASLCVHLGRQGGCALILPGDRRPTALEPTLASWEHAHARLAVVGPAAAPNLAGLASRLGPVYYVAARAQARPPRALAVAQAHGASRVLVVPGRIPGRRAMFVVAGCSGYELSGARAPVEVR